MTWQLLLYLMSLKTLLPNDNDNGRSSGLVGNEFHSCIIGRQVSLVLQYQEPCYMPESNNTLLSTYWFLLEGAAIGRTPPWCAIRDKLTEIGNRIYFPQCLWLKDRVHYLCTLWKCLTWGPQSDRHCKLVTRHLSLSNIVTLFSLGIFWKDSFVCFEIVKIFHALGKKWWNSSSYV